MIQYIVYDNDGSIIQQGNASEKAYAIKKANTRFNIMQISQPLTNLDCYKVEQGVIVEQTPPDHNYGFKRFHNYPSIGHQLDCLYKDIQAGVFGETAKTGAFASLISSVKQQYPKP